MPYQVKIEAFEGPLDLLLHLINRLEIDIYDIPVAQITEQYLMYIKTMKDLKLDVASEYLVMAATLLAIKSKMLLPKHEENDHDDEVELSFEEDPRDELVERLIEYRKFKEAAQELKLKEEERGLMYTKPPSDLSGFAKDINSTRTELNVSLYDMLAAYQKLMRRKKMQRPMKTKITRQEISIETRMSEILDELKEQKGRKNFFDLFPYPSKDHIVVTFLAVLELIKRKEIDAHQQENFGDIYIVAVKGGEDAIGNN
ncbi:MULTISPECIES: segregation/condensation protein A [Neobacillus]|jgi:segregation and condensation protein A|uniref:Segregation and condensation protein A n=1 Tax=Neobacillus sedimentimangrovi TaxID=2699460 RepID=A0ABS8QKS6_9BACI|nr:segregation/condensation protein A [Neobacillus sedimentimangrovi]AIM15495.1 segregation and condensation protein A [Bacillus sp. X1(2014)]MCD4839778.1 segregation/condensation protein A [Neobacillus sedimentimangrovi]